MGKLDGFMKYTRELPEKRLVEERVRDFKEFYNPFPEDKIRNQAGRCMDCGVPFCHTGCPLGNIIPDWNDLVYQKRWEEAIKRLHTTNNFPEFTGRLCPAPCEEACVLSINEQPVTIEFIEKSIIERAFEEDWVVPEPPNKRTDKTVAIVGSGPAGLACAQQLNKAGHRVTVFERDDRIGGLLRYGIPDFKIEKWIIDRRLQILKDEGIIFITGVHVGKDYSVEDLKEFDAIVLCIGSTKSRDMHIPGRDLDGIHLAMEYLPQQNKVVAGDDIRSSEKPYITAQDKNVVVIGGGDTGSDCIGTANRQDAKSVTNFELLPTPPEDRPVYQPWPYWPMKLRTSCSHEEGCNRHWSILTKEFLGSNGKVEKLITMDVKFVPSSHDGRSQIQEIPGSEKEWRVDLVLLALGFLGPEEDNVITQLEIGLDERGNIKTDNSYMTSLPGVFAAGDARRGQSLIVWAISEGREAAKTVDMYLMGETELPSKGGTDLPRV